MIFLVSSVVWAISRKGAKNAKSPLAVFASLREPSLADDVYEWGKIEMRNVQKMQLGIKEDRAFCTQPGAQARFRVA